MSLYFASHRLMMFDADYEALASQLHDAGIVTPLAEMHGGLCGTMCAGGPAAARQWVGECLDDWQLAESDEISLTLRNLEQDAWRKLISMELNFEPLLPDEDDPLQTQVQGLALWCHGFLVGLALGGFKAADAKEHSSAVHEITRDFAELSRAVLGNEPDDSSEAGFALAELKEYVRVGVQLVFEELGDAQHGPGGDRVH